MMLSIFSINVNQSIYTYVFPFSLHFINSRLLLRQILSLLSLHGPSGLLGKDAVVNTSLVCLEIGLTN